MRLACIVRSDSSGLGTLTWEFARHLKPQKVVIVINTANQNFPERYDEFDSIQIESQLSQQQLEWLSTSVDILWTAETFYDNQIISHCRKKRNKDRAYDNGGVAAGTDDATRFIHVS